VSTNWALGTDTGEVIDAGLAARSIILLHHLRWAMRLCTVIGVNGFRVVEASIIRLPFRAQYRATVDSLGRELQIAFR